MKPVKQSKESLIAVLEDILARIKADDSFEGSLSYTAMDEGLARGEFNVLANWRVGNSEGQGGCVMIGE